jgi:hypothetical protein
MLQFLQGWLWLFGAAAALPVILHLLSRQRLEKIRFSSLMLLTRLEKSQMRRLKVRQLLLLILRTLAVLTLVFAFARPLLRNTDSRLSNTQTAAVLVIDESASMSAMGNTGRRIDRARELGRQIVESFGPGDRVALLSDTGSAAPPNFEYGRADWLALIDSVSSHDGRSDLKSALLWAQRELDTVSTGAREIYLITDGQASAWQSAVGRPETDVRVYVASVGEELQPNRGVRSVDFGGALWVAHSPAELGVRVANYGPDIHDLPVSLFVDGNRVAQSAVSIRHEDSGSVALVIPDLEPGWHHGRVEISSDAWPRDNVLYFAFEAAASLPVLVVGDDPGVVAPVQAALRPGPTARTPFQPETEGAARLGTAIDPAIGLVVLAGAEGLPPAAWERLFDFVRGGGGLVVFPGAESARDNYNRHLLEPLWNAQWVGRSDSLPARSFVTLERPPAHAMFQFLDQTVAFPEIRFRGMALLTPVAAGAVRQRFSDRSPAVIEATLGRGHVVFFAGFASPKESDLIFHPVFVPIVQSVATYAARRGALHSEPWLAVGRRPEGLPVAEGDWRWVVPSGDTATLPGGPSTLPALSEAGIYQLLRGDSVAAYYAANLDPAELDLTAFTAWEDVLGPTRAVVLDPGGPIDKVITEARVGLDLWFPATVLALLFLVAEMIVAWPGRNG